MLGKLTNYIASLRKNVQAGKEPDALSGLQASHKKLIEYVELIAKRVNTVITNDSSEALVFIRTRDVKAPERGTSLSAGYDFFLPNDYGVTAENNKPQVLTLNPGQSALVPTGIHVKFPEQYVFIGFNKSGVASKKSLLIGAQVIDADYQGEMHINLHNVGSSVQEFAPGQKLTQFILLNVALLPIVEVNDLIELYVNGETERGVGGFSSTGL